MSRIAHVLGGGTFAHVRNHMSLAAPAFGTTAKALYLELLDYGIRNDDAPFSKVRLHLTKMADPSSDLVTNEDVARRVDEIIDDPETKIVFFNVAMCDFDGRIGNIKGGKYAPRLKTAEGETSIALTPAAKVIGKIRKHRKDIFLVGFKTTCGETEDEQYRQALNLMKKNHINLVLANDTLTLVNMIVVPEEARYHVTENRTEALAALVEMAVLRSQLRFTRSTVIDGPRVDWNDERVPENLRLVINHCIKRGAYKPFNGTTAGHFAVKIGDDEFFTSARWENFNELPERGLVRVISSGPDEVISYGAKPSVGGQSQRIIFGDHADKGLDCIVHFHCPTKPGSQVNVREQRPFECGSHECGQNTSDGIRDMGEGIYAVMLDNHGPNIVYNRNVPAEKVIRFIEENFDLDAKTGGPVAA